LFGGPGIEALLAVNQLKLLRTPSRPLLPARTGFFYRSQHAAELNAAHAGGAHLSEGDLLAGALDHAS
jgi:hypothetical protein